MGSKQWKIVGHKTSSFIHKVNYDQIVNELRETDLTNDDKKNIGNITFGVLEKSHNTAQKGYVFTLWGGLAITRGGLEEGFVPYNKK